MKNKIVIAFVLAGTLCIGVFLGKVLFTASSHDTHEHNTSIEESVWTCSMHPQIRQDEQGDCPICGMDLIPLSVNVDFETGSNELQMTNSAVQLANIQTTTIGLSNGEQSMLKLNGKIEVNETEQFNLVSHIPGRIEQLFVRFDGDYIQKGQKLATIYSPEIITAQKELLEAQKLLSTNPSLLEAAKNKLRYWKIEESTIEEMLKSKTIIEQFNIHAEHSGTVSNKKVVVGDYISKGEVLFSIQDLNTLWAIFDVYENQLSKIKKGDIIEFGTSAYSYEKFKAEISFIDPAIDASTRVTKIRAEVNNSNGLLKPEMFIEGNLIISSADGKIEVPKSAVLWTGKRSVVYVKKSNTDIPSFEYREIELGESTEQGYIVLSGLQNGEEVVTNGAFVIDASAQLNNQKSMMNKQVEIRKNEELVIYDFSEETPAEFKAQLEMIVKDYLAIKDALIESNIDLAQQKSIGLANSLDLVDMHLIKDDAHTFWMEKYKMLSTNSNLLQSSMGLEEQRTYFLELSKNLIQTIKAFGVNQSSFYVQHCPMAFDDGGDWLSNSTQILNPYFGEKMLTCGTVQDTIDINFKNPPMQEQSNVQINLHNH